MTSGRSVCFDARREFTDEQTGLNAVFTSDMGVAGRLTYGGDWYHDDIDSSISNPDGDGDTVQFPDDSYYSRYGAFLYWDVKLTDRLRATSGVRYEFVEAGATVTVDDDSRKIDPEFEGWIGQGGLTYEVTPSLNLVGSISEGFRAPNLDDLAAVNSNVFVGTQLPNPDLDPETSLTYEIGAKFSRDRAWGQVFVWWTDLEDHILRTPPDDTTLLLTRTNKDSYLQGVEGSGEMLLASNWSVYGNFWYTFGEDEVDEVPLSRIPPTQGILGLRRRWGGGQNWFDVYGWLANEQDRLSPRDLADTRRIPPTGTPGYGTVNFRFGRMISGRQRLSVNVENLFDEQYRVHGSGSDGPGINAIVTYEWLR